MTLGFDDFESSIKVIVVGNGGVGKTSLIRRFATGEYEDSYKKTIGAAFCEKEQYVSSIDQTVKFMLWDTAGQEEFDAVTRRYYRGAGACVVAFSTTDRNSFEAIAKWIDKVTQECGEISMVLIQNKVDLLDQTVVETYEADALARQHNLKLFRTCVKEDVNVKEVFDHLAQSYFEQQQKNKATFGSPRDAAPPLSEQPFVLPDNNTTEDDIRRRRKQKKNA